MDLTVALNDAKYISALTTPSRLMVLDKQTFSESIQKSLHVYNRTLEVFNPDALLYDCRGVTGRKAKKWGQE